MTKTQHIPGTSDELAVKIEACDNEVRTFLLALHKENEKLHGKITALEVSNTSLENKVKSLQKHKLPHEKSDDELEVEIIPVIAGHVRDAGGWQKFCEQNNIDPDSCLFNQQ